MRKLFLGGDRIEIILRINKAAMRFGFRLLTSVFNVKSRSSTLFFCRDYLKFITLL
jgi:hypothetical protein